MTQAVHSAQGRDVSDFQPVQTVASWTGFDFGFAKATEGTGWTGQTFAKNWANMEVAVRSRGFARGAYHFLHPGEDPIAQARHFVTVVKASGLKPGDMLVVDSEIMSGLSADEANRSRRVHAPVTTADLAVTTSQADACTIAFCDEVRWLVGPAHPIIVYTMHVVGEHLVNTAARYPLWFAWPSATAPPFAMIAPWKTWLFWQWAFASKNGGDADAFNGTPDDLKAFIKRYLPKPSKPWWYRWLPCNLWRRYWRTRMARRTPGA